MEIKLYNTNSPNNKIGKTLENETIFDCHFKHDNNCDILKPTIIIQSENFLNFNYAYIDQFKRYYFIEDITIFPNNIYVVTLSVDVLESWKNDILNSDCDIIKQENFNAYYNDNYQNLVTKNSDKYNSDTSNKLETKTILITIGG